MDELEKKVEELGKEIFWSIDKKDEVVRWKIILRMVENTARESRCEMTRLSGGKFG
jgi:hypothetical protein